MCLWKRRRIGMFFFSLSLFIFIVFCNRYFFGLFLKRGKGKRFEPVDTSYEPAVTVVIPMYNEGCGIYSGLLSILKQDYPPEKLSISIIDDCSTDDSLGWACKAAQCA